MDIDKRSQDIGARFGGVEDHDPSTRFERAILLFERTRHIGHVAHQEARNDGIKALVWEGEIECVGGRPMKMGILFASAHHFEGEICSQSVYGGMLFEPLACYITGTSP